MTKRHTVTIGIPAHNEEANIGFLINDLLQQDLGEFALERIIVASDGSTDNTVNVVYSIKNSKIVLIDGRENLGKAFRLNEVISRTNSDVLVLLDADISIPDKSFIKKLVEPIFDDQIDLTSSAIKELEATSYFEKVLLLSMKLKTKLFREFKAGNNVYNCHGPARAFSKNMYKQFRFIKSEGEDMYSYLVCTKLGMKFKYVASAKVYYKLPTTPTDHYKQSLRYLNSIEDCRKIFGEEFVNKEFKIPVITGIKAALKSMPLIFTNILPFVFYLITYGFSNLFLAMKVKAKDTWKVATSKKIMRNGAVK